MIKVFGKILLISFVILGCSYEEDFTSLKDEMAELRKDISEMKEEPEPKPERKWFLVSDRKSLAEDDVTEERKFEITGEHFEIIWGASTHPKWGVSRATITLYKENGVLVSRMAETTEPDIGVQPFKTGSGSYYLKITYRGVLSIIIREFR
jgi:hypothetical protein